MARATWLMLVKDVRAQIRNRTILIIGLIAPLSLAFVLNLVFGGAAGPTSVTFEVGLVAADRDQLAEQFTTVVDQVSDAGFVEVERFANEGAARAAVDEGEVGAAWVVSEAVIGAPDDAAPPEILVLGSVDAPNTVALAQSVAERFSIGLGTVALATQVVVETGAAPRTQAPFIAMDVAASPPLAALEPIEADASEVLDLTTSLTAGLALFFGFFVGGLPLLSLLEERSGGTLGRLLVAPIPSGAIVAGKALAAIVIGVASLATLMVASSVLMGADWGPPLGALILAGAFVVAAVGLMTAAGSTASTSEQASNVQGITAVGLGLLGGAFVPIPTSESSLLGQIQRVTPHGWFLDGLAAVRTEGVAAAFPSATVLVAIGVGAAALSMRASSRSLRR